MIRQDKLSWNQGRADAMRGAPSKCPKGLDALSYASGYIEGEAQRAKRTLRAITSPKANPHAPAARSDQARQRRKGITRRNCALLQCEPLDDFETLNCGGAEVAAPS